MPEGYGTHSDYMDWVAEDATKRQQEVAEVLRTAFNRFIERREVEVINFSMMTAMDLAEAIHQHPKILKPILASCNVAGRAIERDLDIRNIDTYTPRLTREHSLVIAGYLKPFLPQELAIPALTELDRHFYVDKQIRMIKGQWEKTIRAALNAQANVKFKKRQFVCDNDQFELDAAAPETGPIEIGVDVKRIEARRDIHKRCDEIVNKASKFKKKFEDGKFVAVVYYPFTAEHLNIRNRLESPNIDAVAFASQAEEQLNTAVGLVVDKLGIRRRDK